MRALYAAILAGIGAFFAALIGNMLSIRAFGASPAGQCGNVGASVAAIGAVKIWHENTL
jgi:hypothetical protein